MWNRRDLDERAANTQLRTGRQIFEAKIEINVQLISGQLPSFRILRNERSHTRIHNVQLHFRVRFPAQFPVVTDKTVCNAEDTGIDRVPFTNIGALYDQSKHSAVTW